MKKTGLTFVLLMSGGCLCSQDDQQDYKKNTYGEFSTDGVSSSVIGKGVGWHAKPKHEDRTFYGLRKYGAGDVVDTSRYLRDGRRAIVGAGDQMASPRAKQVLRLDGSVDEHRRLRRTGGPVSTIVRKYDRRAIVSDVRQTGDEKPFVLSVKQVEHAEYSEPWRKFPILRKHVHGINGHVSEQIQSDVFNSGPSRQFSINQVKFLQRMASFPAFLLRDAQIGGNMGKRSITPRIPETHKTGIRTVFSFLVKRNPVSCK